MSRPILFLILGFAAASGLADETGLARLESARQLWQTAGIDDYRYRYQKYCDCYRGEPPVTVVTVRRGTIERVFHLHDDSNREVPARDGSLDLYWTVPDLFDKLQAAYDLGATVDVDYDSGLGYPARLYIDYDATLIGDETDLRLSGVERF